MNSNQSSPILCESPQKQQKKQLKCKNKSFVLIECKRSKGNSRFFKFFCKDFSSLGEIMKFIEDNLNIPHSYQWIIDPNCDLKDKFDDFAISIKDLPSKMCLYDIRDIPIKIEHVEEAIQPYCGWDYVWNFFQKCLVNNVFMRSDYFANWVRKISEQFQEELMDNNNSFYKIPIIDKEPDIRNEEKRKELAFQSFNIYFKENIKNYMEPTDEFSITEQKKEDPIDNLQKIKNQKNNDLMKNNNHFIDQYKGYMSNEILWEAKKQKLKVFLDENNLLLDENLLNYLHCKHNLKENCLKCIAREIVREFVILIDSNETIYTTNNGYYCIICNLELLGKGKSKAINHIRNSKKHKTKINDPILSQLNNLQINTKDTHELQQEKKNENDFTEISEKNGIEKIGDQIIDVLKKYLNSIKNDQFQEFDGISHKLSHLNSENSKKNVNENLKQEKQNHIKSTNLTIFEKYRLTFGSSNPQNESEFHQIFKYLEENKLSFNRESIEKYIKTVKPHCMATTNNKLKRNINRYFLKPNQMPLLRIAKNIIVKPREIISEDKYLHIKDTLKVFCSAM